MRGVGVSLLFVSHSRLLAEGAAELAGQVAQGKVEIAAVGGTRDGRLGTDPCAIRRAMEELGASRGVLVLMDLGSAVMAAEAALDEVDPSLRPRVRLADGPIVEGGVAAAVQASLGSDLDEVAESARQAGGQSKLLR
ncbi:MAG: dihydroxyacetone kinase phosphoryl donor subunit DhaM [Candidatus Dormibacterales bacterium]